MTNPAAAPAPLQPHRPVRHRWPLWAALLAAVVFAVAMVWIPMWEMRPFQPQSSAGLARAFAVRRIAPAATLLALLLAAGLAWRLWQATRWAGRLALAVALLVIGAASWAVRQELFERMFPPLHHPGYVRAAAAAAFVAPAEMVMAIQVAGETVAYPVRQVAYHHVVEDVVGGTPLVVTY
jgi:flagellar biogenesis protein FliO